MIEVEVFLRRFFADLGCKGKQIGHLVFGSVQRFRSALFSDLKSSLRCWVRASSAFKRRNSPMTALRSVSACVSCFQEASPCCER